MRIVSGTVRSTPTSWLPILSNTAPPALRRLTAAKREWDKTADQRKELPIQQDLANLPVTRLRSRQPIWTDQNLEEPINIAQRWNELFHTNPELKNRNLVPTAAVPLPGMDLPRKTWTRLNRFRCGHGRCRDLMFKWNMIDSPECDCGAPRQTMNHIVEDCPARRFPGGLHELNEASPTAIKWLDELEVDV